MSSAPNPSDWAEKARQDVRAARRLLIDPPELEAAAYHVHQAAEKAMKAILASRGVAFARNRGAGHDFGKLSRLIPVSDAFHARAQGLSDLTPWATVFRYPSDDPFTAQPLPAKQEIERSLDEAEALVEAVALQVAASAPPSR